MASLAARHPDAGDVLISVQHPPTITVGRRGAHGMIHARSLDLPGRPPLHVDVHEVPRGGSVTWHAPGQLVVYPVLRLTRLARPLGRPPLGDLPAYARALERAMEATCTAFGLATRGRPGFAGLWLDERRKIASLGVAIQSGWTTHGIALNVCPHLAGFDLITPCGLDGVEMTSLWRELDELGLPRPPLETVEARLLDELAARLTLGVDGELA